MSESFRRRFFTPYQIVSGFEIYVYCRDKNASTKNAIGKIKCFSFLNFRNPVCSSSRMPPVSKDQFSLLIIIISEILQKLLVREDQPVALDCPWIFIFFIDRDSCLFTPVGEKVS
ncbi:hypothetical protein CEXT_405961 [Caerostris extrusa]|uniref:Uncharacterized protein n=1 Tax=Caerostris extrusa TaxID=172846 RepID=A0AAV4TH66_CAEEX|nr:hypothetical protein CEXT_405961 [Caerostris extrusa]